MAREFDKKQKKLNHCENNFTEREEDEIQEINGAVLHVLSSNGVTNHNPGRSTILTKGKIIKNHEMGKRNINSVPSKKNGILPAETCLCGNVKNGLKANKKENIKDDTEINTINGPSCSSADSNSNLNVRKIQNGTTNLNSSESSPDSSPVDCSCKRLNGNGGHRENDVKFEKSPIVRPKSISWSRMVKQRKENKLKERNGRRGKRSCQGYIYPELCSSSEESSDDNVKTSNISSGLDEGNEKCAHSIKSLCNESYRLNGIHGFSEVRNGFSSSQEVTSSSTENGGGSDGSKVANILDPARLSLGQAPLAVPEDSDTGRSSISSCSDGRSNDCMVENNIFKSVSEDNLRLDGIDIRSGGSKAEALPNGGNVMEVTDRNILPLPRNPSVDSLEEIGDYIETDFPSKASRLLFQSSSRSSSPSTDDEDEGYVVNKTKSKHIHDEKTVDQSYDRSSCPLNATSHNINPSDLMLRIEQNVPPTSQPHYNNTSHAAHRIARLSSGAGSESERGGIQGSDSSYVYTPETDYQEFIDSDLPSSEANNLYSNGNREFVVAPQVDNYVEDYVEPDPNLGADNQMIGAEGGATNNLNLEGRCLAFDYLDSNMEVYDPHCDQPDDDNYLLRVIYKHEKVPIANFQNSESNKREKIFCKLALDGDDSTMPGSSDEEENVFHHYARDVQCLSSVQHQTDSSDHMVVEDLENLTHALQNAVIMHLSSQHDESSDASSEEPIYEEIDNLDPLTTGDNSLHIVEEEPGSVSKVNTMPKYTRRRRHGKRGSDVDKVMIWNEYEAYVLQVKQIGTSACGPTAVLNILKAFDYQVDKDEVCKKVPANLRMEAAPIPYYLFSRYNAGTTADALIDGINKLTKGTIRGRFFHFYPERKVELLKWLGYWMRKGAVPLATLNLQRGVKPGWTIPDAWHHQMIYGVSSKGVYLTNPLEIVPEATIMEQLTSDSVLLIRRQDVVNRFRDWAPLNEFLKKSDQRWQTMNVLGQVVNVLREACTALSHQGPRYRAQLTSHITIPAAYKAGITLFVRHNTEVCQELFNAPELELKNPETEDSG